MEGYLRIGLLSIAVIIVFLILFEAWYRHRQTKITNTSLISELSKLTHPDEILGLNQNEPFLSLDAEKELQLQTISPFEDPDKILTSSPDDLDPLLNDIESGKLLYPYEKEVKNHPEKHLKTFNINEDSFFQEGEKLNIAPAVEIANAPASLKKNDFLVISIFAKGNDQFASYDLLQAISATGMQYGDMNIFHYYLDGPHGKIKLFSLASATEPGDFDLDQIGDFSCVGLTLFMDLCHVPDPQQAFDIMLSTAEQLADDLDGELRTGQHTPLYEHHLQELQQKVLDYTPKYV